MEAFGRLQQLFDKLKLDSEGDRGLLLVLDNIDFLVLPEGEWGTSRQCLEEPVSPPIGGNEHGFHVANVQFLRMMMAKYPQLSVPK